MSRFEIKLYQFVIVSFVMVRNWVLTTMLHQRLALKYKKSHAA
jgi:hypothetical protein